MLKNVNLSPKCNFKKIKFIVNQNFEVRKKKVGRRKKLEEIENKKEIKIKILDFREKWKKNL